MKRTQSILCVVAVVSLTACSHAQVEPVTVVEAPVIVTVPPSDCVPNRDGVPMCGDAPFVVQCGELGLSELAEEGAVCERQGDGKRIVLRGDVLAFDRTYAGGSVVIEGDRIVYVGCSPDLTDASVITCPDSVISPGLINAHEHLNYSNARPAVWGDERFDHRHDWRKGLNGHTLVPGPSTDHNDVPEMRALLSGTTSIFGSGSEKGLVRNLDKESPVGDDTHLPIYQTFPLSDHTGMQIESGCGYSKYANDDRESCPYGPHIGEGINDAARNELVCLSSDEGRDIFKSNLAVIHGVAATSELIAKMAQNDVKMVWSPRTNIALYGDTARITAFDELGVTIGLGTDWIYSGSANMLRELRCVDDLNRDYFGHHFSDYALWLMPTVGSAAALGVSHVLGRLAPNYVADIAMFRKTPDKQAHRAVIAADNADVLLVMLGGKVVYGESSVMTSGRFMDVCGIEKKFDNIAARSEEFDTIESYAAYPLYFCAEPEDEPTCVPQRVREADTTAQDLPIYTGVASGAADVLDRDGDGVPDSVDNCPAVFNPIRPTDHPRVQSDLDGDGVGDACDAWPTCSENTASCLTLNAHDRDNDGVPNFFDNCPNDVNPDQADRDRDGLGDACDPCDDATDQDGDGIGDACDPCPQDGQNEDGLGCSLPVTPISEIRNTHINGTLKEDLIKIQGVVTGIAPRLGGIGGIFVQDLHENVAVMLYHPEDAQNVRIGDLIEVKGSTSVYYSLVQIKPTSINILSSDHARLPLTMTAEQATANTTPEVTQNAFDSVLITVHGLTLDRYDETQRIGECYMAHDSEGHELCVDDYLIGTGKLQNVLEMNKTYDITGILLYDYGREKLAPRQRDDISVSP